MSIAEIFEKMDRGNPLSDSEIDHAISCLTSILGCMDTWYKPYILMISDMNNKLDKLNQWKTARNNK